MFTTLQSAPSFIRFTSLNLKDPNNALYPYEAFSAQFRCVMLCLYYLYLASDIQGILYLQPQWHVWTIQPDCPSTDQWRCYRGNRWRNTNRRYFTFAFYFSIQGIHNSGTCPSLRRFIVSYPKVDTIERSIDDAWERWCSQCHRCCGRACRVDAVITRLGTVYYPLFIAICFLCFVANGILRLSCELLRVVQISHASLANA